MRESSAWVRTCCKQFSWVVCCASRPGICHCPRQLRRNTGTVLSVWFLEHRPSFLTVPKWRYFRPLPITRDSKHKCPSTFLAVRMLEVSFPGASVGLRAPSCFPLLQARLCQQPWTLRLAAASVSGAMCVLGADSSLARGWLGAAGHPGGARAVEMSSERSLSLPGRYHTGVLVLFSHGNRRCSLGLLHARPFPGHVTVPLTSVSQGVCCPQLTADYTEHQFSAWSVSGMGCLGMLKSNPK